MPQSPGREVRLQKALQELEKGHVKSILQASKRNFVPYKTLYDRKVLGRQSHREGAKEQQKLTPIQELYLVAYAQQLEQKGVPARQDLLRARAQQILRRNGSNLTVVGQHWVKNFLRRHPSLEIKRPDRLDKQRKLASTVKTLDHHLTLFENIKKDLKILPEHMWNIDKKGFLLEAANKVKVICKRSRGAPILQVDGGREFVTVLEAVSAMGRSIGPYFIWKGKHHTVGRYIPGVGEPDTRFACSSNGWTSYELAQEWLEKHFNPLTRPKCIYLPVVIKIPTDGQ